MRIVPKSETFTRKFSALRGGDVFRIDDHGGIYMRLVREVRIDDDGESWAADSVDLTTGKLYSIGTCLPVDVVLVQGAFVEGE